jgi:hypothetical protein
VDDARLHRHRHRRRAFDGRRFGRRHAPVARAAEHARLDDAVGVGVGEVAEQLLRRDRFDDWSYTAATMAIGSTMSGVTTTL